MLVVALTADLAVPGRASGSTAHYTIATFHLLDAARLPVLVLVHVAHSDFLSCLLLVVLGYESEIFRLVDRANDGLGLGRLAELVVIHVVEHALFVFLKNA